VTRRDLSSAPVDTTQVLGESRGRVLDALRSTERPVSVEQVARQVGLHANTVRFHLDALVTAGLVGRDSEERTQPGRPRALYSALPGSAGSGRRSYQLLAEILSGFLAAHLRRPQQASVQAGQTWGRYLTEHPPPFRHITAAAATQQLLGVLDRVGFAPELDPTARQRVLLRHCPFREVAQEHRDVVCSIHLGLMQGVLTELDAPLTAERLEPFVEPSLCVAYLGKRSAAPDHRGKVANV
jgi:predicted ArsR family transcriptional regulator